MRGHFALHIGADGSIFGEYSGHILWGHIYPGAVQIYGRPRRRTPPDGKAIVSLGYTLPGYHR